ncbi:MAG TPA: hypothetical protein VIK64_14625 [Anaerolineales bacterium]
MNKFGGFSAILVGILSILYAVFYLVIARQAEYVGTYGSWLILALSGLFSGAAYVALYRRVSPDNQGVALWALLLGFGASFATLQHGAYQAMLVSRIRMAEAPLREALQLANRLPSQVDPAGLATFLVVGVVAFLFSWLILSSDALPRPLGFLGIFNAFILVVLYFASAGGLQRVILVSGGLTSVIVGPIWWIWLGLALLRAPEIVATQSPVGST